MKPSEEITDTTAKKEKTTLFSFVKKHPAFVTFILALIVIGGVILWKDISRSTWQKEFTTKANVEYVENQESLMKLVAKTLVWQIRSEVLRNNTEQIDLLLIDMLNENNIEYLHYATTDGNVVLSTNKKVQGQNLNDLFAASILNTDEPTIEYMGNTLVVGAPIMGIDKKLGMLIIGYNLKKLSVE